MFKSGICLLFFFSLTVLFAKAQPPISDADAKLFKQIHDVKPINWSRINTDIAPSPQQLLAGKVLLNCNKYALTNWWKLRGFAGTPINDYLDLKGITEHYIRPIAAEAEALAVSLRTGLYNEDSTGVSKADAEAKTLQLIRSLAHAHRANKPNGWGKQWQSSLWASYTAYAAWMMWDKLDLETKKQVLSMTNFECDWILSNKGLPNLKTYRDRNGKVISPGDTGAEENAWDALILGVASAMMPDYPERPKWMERLIFLSLNAMARPSDTQSSKKYNGKSLNNWLVGSNFNEDGTNVNHHFIHPDYMSAVFELNPTKYFWLANLKIPKTFTFNAEVVFHAFADLQFKEGDTLVGGKVIAPGGTIFKPESGAVFYPLGTDWGKGRRMHFAMFNSMLSVLSSDEQIVKRAEQWQLLQGQVVLDMQNRFSDGHTYIGKSEDSYESREEWVADKAATAYIIELLKMQGKAKFSNQRF